MFNFQNYRMSTKVKIDKAIHMSQPIVGSYEWAQDKVGEIPLQELQKAQPLYQPSIGTFRNAEVSMRSATPKSCKPKVYQSCLPGGDPNFHLAPIWVSPPDNPDTAPIVNLNKRNKIKRRKVAMQKKKKNLEKTKEERKKNKSEKINEFSTWGKLGQPFEGVDNADIDSTDSYETLRSGMSRGATKRELHIEQVCK